MGNGRPPTPPALLLTLCLAAMACGAATAAAPRPAHGDGLSRADDEFLDQLQHDCFRFFWEQADPQTGLVRDRAGADGGPSANPRSRDVASIAAVGFGLTGICVADGRGWVGHDEAYVRVLATLRYLRDGTPNEHGFYYHFLDLHTGGRAWKCELSSIDTALLTCGVLTARQHFTGTEVERLGAELYERVDWPWMLAGGKTLSMGWKPEGGGKFLESRWHHFDEGWLLYLLAMGSRTHRLPPECWRAWERGPKVTYAGRTFMQHPPLFVHQFPQAYFDVRGMRDDYADYFQNSVDATLAHRQWCIDQRGRFPKWGEDLWGVTSSDSVKGYLGWGGPPVTENGADDLDGTIAPCAAAGSLPFAPAECLRTLRHLRSAYGDRLWKRYGFPDAFNPQTGWVATDVVGIDLGITLVMAENLRTGRVWEEFGRNAEVKRALDAAGFRKAAASGD